MAALKRRALPKRFMAGPAPGWRHYDQGVGKWDRFRRSGGCDNELM